MSDTPQGPDWWLGADGKYYPPVAAAPAPPAPPGADDQGDTDPAGDTPEGRTRPRWVIPAVIGGAAVLLIAVAGVLAITLLGGSSPSHPLTGTMTLTTASLFKGKDQSCVGSKGFDDIDSNAQVTVTDGDGKLLATGSLGEGHLADGSTVTCVFPLNVATKLPKADFYKVEVSHRGALTYSYDQMQAQNWDLSLTLG